MKHLVSYSALGLILGGCFGKGPLPSDPTGATVVFRVAPAPPGKACTDSRYIGSVAIGPGSKGYLTELMYVPHDGNCIGAPMPTDATAFSFATDGAGDIHGTSITRPLGVSGGNGVERPRVAVDGTGNPVWFYYESPGGLAIDSSASGQISVDQPPNSSPLTVGVVADASDFYVGIQAMGEGGHPDPDNPTFPCCDPRIGSGNTGAIWRISADGATKTPLATPYLFSDVAEHGMVVTSSDVLYLEHANGGGPGIGAVAKDSSTMPRMMWGASQATGLLPVGLAADATDVVWTVSADFVNDLNASHCEVWMTSAAMPMPPPGPLFKTDAFSCMDAAIDGTYVYFTMVHVEQSNEMSPPIHGDGIARVSLDSGQLEDVLFKMSGAGAGPRRIYIDNDNLLVVDPLAIARIPKGALDGRQDVAP
jgi:hypothetical protein